MFWKKDPPKPGPVLSQPAPSIRVLDAARAAENELDRAISTVGAMLRTFAQYAFDTDKESARDVQERAEQLLRRFTMGASKRDDQEGSIPPDSATLRRDWAALHRFLEAARKTEFDYVTHGLENLRHALQEFAHAITLSIAEDRASDATVEKRVGRLLDACEGNDTGVIRREATDVARVVRSAMTRRRERETEQFVKLGQQVKALREELDSARARATLDSLTQLFNRASFDEELEKVAKLGLLLGSEPCLVLLDVDHFKSVNDQHGHPVGDIALKAVADNLVRHFLRKEDFVARYGGEEFAIVVRDSTLEKVASRAERAREVMEETEIVTPAGPLKLTFSAGVTPLNPGETPAEWIARADKALYSAKHAGRNRVESLPVPTLTYDEGE